MNGWKPYDRDQEQDTHRYHETLDGFLHGISHHDLQAISHRVVQAATCAGVHPESFQKHRPDTTDELKQLIMQRENDIIRRR